MPNNQPQKTCRTCGISFPGGLIKCPHCGASSLKTTPEGLVKCKSCNHDMAQYAMKCPHCGEWTSRCYVTLVLVSLAVIFSVLSVVLMFNFGVSAPNVDKNRNTIVQENNNAEVPELSLYSDKVFDIEYMKLYDIPNNDYVTCSYLQLKVTNKSSQTITLSLDNVYVNDIVVQSGTAMPIELEPGKISTTPFILFTGNTGLSAEDITKVEFKLTADDDNFNRIHTTSKITVAR